MAWADIDSDLVVLQFIRSDGLSGAAPTAAPGGAEPQDITAALFDREQDATDYLNRQGALRLLARSSPILTDGVLALTRQDLETSLGGPPTAHPWILLTFDYGRANGACYALITWDEDEGFICRYRSIQLTADEIHVHHHRASTIESFFGLTLYLPMQAPGVTERVYLAGGQRGANNPHYEDQVRALVLAGDFAEHIEWPGGVHWPDHVIAANLTTIRADNETITLISSVVHHQSHPSPHDNTRSTFARMYPPGATSPEDFPDPLRPWVHWFRVFRVDRTADPANPAPHSWGVHWAYAYLRSVATDAPGTLLEFASVGHAIMRGPQQLHTGGAAETGLGAAGQPPDFPGAGNIQQQVVGAFSADSSFRVYGCNASTQPRTGAPRLNLVERQTLADIEGIIRVHIRLLSAVSGIQAKLDEGNVAGARADAATQFARLPGAGNRHPWQLPADDHTFEGVLRGLSPTRGRRDGGMVRNLIRAQITVLRRWAGLTAGAATTDAVAARALQQIEAAVHWPAILALRLAGGNPAQTHTVEVWIDRAMQALSADQHYLASFAHMAAQLGRNDIGAFGGNPGQDGQYPHLLIALPDGRTVPNAVAGLSTRITAYERHPEWSSGNRPWMMSFYRRLGLNPDGLGYFRYDGILDGTGDFVHGFDHGTLNP